MKVLKYILPECKLKVNNVRHLTQISYPQLHCNPSLVLFRLPQQNSLLQLGIWGQYILINLSH